MKKIDKNWLLEEYNDTVKKAELELSKNNRLHAIWLCEYAGFLAWKYPFLYNFSDDNLEKIIINLSSNLYEYSFQPKKNRIVFFTSQIVDNGALTQQYLHFFIKKNVEVLFIVSDRKYNKYASEILNTIKDCNNIELFLPQDNSAEKKINSIRRKIQQFQPSFAFLHLLPNDVVGCLSFINIKPTTTFYIVHNDHTFWLGKSIFDYYIEFRQFGISMAIERRRVPKEKILHIPYYPIRSNEPFQGFPFDRSNKVIGISGANLYKYLVDPELKYFYVIKKLINTHPNFVFCLCGRGDSETVNDFINRNNLSDRFYFLGHRNDFYNLVGQADIFFESYPLKGGLTPLFATEQRVPCIGIATNNNFSGSLEDLLDIEGYQQPKNLIEFEAEAEKLIKNKEYRNELGLILSKNRYNALDFEDALIKVLNVDLDSLRPRIIKPLQLNDSSNLQEYLNLKDSSKENIILMKLYMLKSFLPFTIRLNLLGLVLKSTNARMFKSKLRILLLILRGR